MGGCVMVNVMKGVSGSLAGNYATHDHETDEYPENECCAGETCHDISDLEFSIGQEPAGVKNGRRLHVIPYLLYSHRRQWKWFRFFLLSVERCGSIWGVVLLVPEAALPAYWEER